MNITMNYNYRNKKNNGFYFHINNVNVKNTSNYS